MELAGERLHLHRADGFVLPVQQLTEGELLAVLVADKALSEYRGTTFEGRLKAIFDKLTQALPEEVTISPQELAHAFSFQWTGAGAHADGRDLPHAAAGDPRRRVPGDPLSHAEPRRDPMAEVRSLSPGQRRRRVVPSRLLSRQPRDPHLPPLADPECGTPEAAFTAPSSFDPARFLKTKFHAMAGDSPVEIRVRFDAALAGYVGEREWSPRTGFSSPPTAGSTSRSPPRTSTPWSVGSWTGDPGAEIVSPPWVRRRVRDMLKRLVERYAARTRQPSGVKRPARVRVRGPASSQRPPAGQGAAEGKAPAAGEGSCCQRKIGVPRTSSLQGRSAASFAFSPFPYPPNRVK